MQVSQRSFYFLRDFRQILQFFRDGSIRLLPLMRIALRHYPKMIEAMATRHVMYNQQLDFVRQAEREGRCLVIRPEKSLDIGHISHDPEEMQRVYDIGRSTGLRYLEAIKTFYKK